MVGAGGKAFVSLDEIDSVGTGVQVIDGDAFLCFEVVVRFIFVFHLAVVVVKQRIVFPICCQDCDAAQAQKQRQSQNQAQKPIFHGCTPFRTGVPPAGRFAPL